MKEIIGNLWDFYMDQDFVICITTNGFVKKNGDGVCGRGCAHEATRMIPGFASLLGKYIKTNGNIAGIMRTSEDEWGVIIFPVKLKWWEKADKELIKASANFLLDTANGNPMTTFILPRPGCGNGQLEWEGPNGVKELISFLPDNVHAISKS